MRASQSEFEGLGLDILEDAVSYHLRLVNLHVARYLSRAFQDTPLMGGTGKVTALMMAQNRPGITASQIAPYAGKDAPAMTRLIDRLVADGLLRRERDPGSRRRRLLYITAAGQGLLTRIRDAVRLERQQIFGMLEDDEFDQLFRLLRKANAHHVARRLAEPCPAM